MKRLFTIMLAIVLFYGLQIGAQTFRDITKQPYNAVPNDPSKAEFNFQAIQRAIDGDGTKIFKGSPLYPSYFALHENLPDTIKISGAGVVYFPAGETFYISRPLEIIYGNPGAIKLTCQDSYNSRSKIIFKGPYSNSSPKPAITFYRYGYYQKDSITWEWQIRYADGDAFNCQFENIDIEIQDGNPGIFAALSHSGAQGSYVRNCKITLSVAYTYGIYGLPGGSVCENIEVFGAKVGAFLTNSSFQPVLRGCFFSGQSEACVKSSFQSGIFEGCFFKNTPQGIFYYLSSNDLDHAGDVPPSTSNARIVVDNCVFDNVNITGGKAIVGNCGTNTEWAIKMKNTYFNNFSKILAWEDNTGTAVNCLTGMCKANYMTYGNSWEYGKKITGNGTNSLVASDIVSCNTLPINRSDYIDRIPGRSECIDSITNPRWGIDKTGGTDATYGIQNAIDSLEGPIWFPMGNYKISNTLHLKKNTKLIGQLCYYTQFIFMPSDASFKNPKPIIDTEDDPNGEAIFAHFCFLDNMSNPLQPQDSAIHIRWRVGHKSIIDDYYDANYLLIKTGYSSVLVTGNGGGHLRQIYTPWINSTGPGTMTIDGTHEPLSIYAGSFEHTLTSGKPEVAILNSKNVTLWQLQEEDNFQIVEAVNCSNLTFNNIVYNTTSGNTSLVAMKFNNCYNVEVFALEKRNGSNQNRFYPCAIQYSLNGFDFNVPGMNIASYKWGPKILKFVPSDITRIINSFLFK